MRIVNGNLFNATEPVIMHQVNCQGVMGSGVAKTVRELYPDCYNGYVQFIKDHGGDLGAFGQCYVYETNDKYILNVFGQLGFGAGLQTNYLALTYGILNGLIEIAPKVQTQYNKLHPLQVALPYRMSCDRGGGDWDLVVGILQMIEQIANIKFTAYDISNSQQ